MERIEWREIQFSHWLFVLKFLKTGMNKSRFLFLLLCFPVLGWSQGTRWVVVNYQQVFEQFSELQQADARLKQEIQSFREEQAKRLEAHNARKASFQSMREQAANAGLSDEEREKLVDEAATLFESLRAEEQELQKKQVEFNQEAEAKIVRLRREFSQMVTEHIRKLAEERDWGLVLDSSAVGNNGLLVVQYAETSLDVTLEVIRSLNASVEEEETSEEEEGE